MGELIFVAILVVVGVFLAGYRRAAIVLTLVGLAAATGVYYVEERQDRNIATRIKPSEVVLQDVTFNQTFRSSYDMRGKLTNKSQTYAIDRIGFVVTLKDCGGGGNTTCVEIGKTNAYASIRVPPQETRDFTASMYFGSEDIKPKGKLVWEYGIVSIVAKQP